MVKSKIAPKGNNMFIAPIITDAQAIDIISLVHANTTGIRHFFKVMEYLMKNGLLRFKPERERITLNNNFNPFMDDSTAKKKYRFTIPQLKTLVIQMHLPAFIQTPAGDRVESLESLALLCRRLIEPCRLSTIADIFGRSMEQCCRVLRSIITMLHSIHKAKLYFAGDILLQRIALYAKVIQEKSGLDGMPNCFGFIDGTKQFISRPSPRQNAIENENLQRSVYNGHPRRHCLNWQGITVPDGLIISMYGPVEGRRHDATMLSMSRILDILQNHPVFRHYCMYGDPAYGCRDCICCPFPLAELDSFEAEFNSSMSSVRESVEWSFHLIKSQWAFVNWDRKMKVRNSPIGMIWLVATLLTNCLTCTKPRGNQISMYFSMYPPTVEEYLR
jgi:hypothetical protein